MVNGKPSLDFSGVTTPVAPATSGRVNLRAGAGRAPDTFASFLAAGQNAISGQSGGAQNATRQMPASLRPTVERAGKGLGFLPDNYRTGQSRTNATTTSPSAASTNASAAVPTGNVSRTAARRQAQPGAEGLSRQFAGTKRTRAKSKSSPRVSGRPITGRGDIGMTDTRQAASGRSTLTRRSAGMSPAAAAAKAQLTGTPPQGAQASGMDSYSRYSAMIGGLGAGVSSQSFIMQGLGGVNGQMALKNLGYDVQSTPSIQTYAQRLEADPYSLKNSKAIPPGSVLGGSRSVKRPKGEDAARTAILTASHRKKTKSAGSKGNSLVSTFENDATQGLGALAAKFESGSDGVAAIGYDRKGGTSYGKFQIASRPGTMNNFISYLKTEAPDIAQRLQKAGPANTGGRTGRMPAEWRKIAAENPERFENLQNDFIRSSHFEPAKRAIEEGTGVSFDNMPSAVHQVLFSTAVQHGAAGAARIISQAVNRVGADKLQDSDASQNSVKKTGEQLITQIYNLRANQFVSSTSRVQSAVRSRLKQEMREAIQMLA